MSIAPAGWYPVNAVQLRYWDGSRWTDAVQPASQRMTARFRVGIVSDGNWHGGGFLTIARDGVIAAPDRLTKRITGAASVIHQRKQIDIFVARLILPWMSVSIVVSDSDRTLLALVPIVTKQRVRRALDDAGYEVVEHRTWTYQGWPR